MAERAVRAALGAASAVLCLGVALPIAQIVRLSLVGPRGGFAGLSNYAEYFTTPALSASLGHSLGLAALSSVLSVALAFGFALVLTRTGLPWKGLFRAASLLPLYGPSLVPAIAMVYLFGNKGLVTTGLFGAVPGLDIGLYGPTGIVLGHVYYGFAQASLILLASLSAADARLYEAAASLRASPWRVFVTVTLPNSRYGLLSALFVCFTLAFTDFGIPKVVGGNFSMLATDVYKQVVGQQNFTRGAVVSVLLLLPSLAAFLADRAVRARQAALVGGRATPLRPRPHRVRDLLALGFCVAVAVGMALPLATAAFASLVRIWPYDLGLGLSHYDFERAGVRGLRPYWTSLRVAAGTAAVGTAVSFLCAVLIHRIRGHRALRSLLALLSMLPVAVPGLVLGLAYLLTFNGTPLYGTATLLVLCNSVHFFTAGHLTASTALRALDPELEEVSASLRVPWHRTLGRVTIPLCLPALVEIALYFFVSSMASVSAVIFLYGPGLPLASVEVVHLDEAGDTAAAAAMSMLLVTTNLAARLLASLARRWSSRWVHVD
jgi:iron(III) transport system permease protein